MFKCKYKNIIKKQKLRLITVIAVIAFLPLSKPKYNSKKLHCVYIIQLSSYLMGAATDGISVTVIFYKDRSRQILSHAKTQFQCLLHK